MGKVVGISVLAKNSSVLDLTTLFRVLDNATSDTRVFWEHITFIIGTTSKALRGVSKIKSNKNVIFGLSQNTYVFLENLFYRIASGRRQGELSKTSVNLLFVEGVIDMLWIARL